jgi:hypothetical protein
MSSCHNTTYRWYMLRKAHRHTRPIFWVVISRNVKKRDWFFPPWKSISLVGKHFRRFRSCPITILSFKLDICDRTATKSPEMLANERNRFSGRKKSISFFDVSWNHDSKNWPCVSVCLPQHVSSIGCVVAWAHVLLNKKINEKRKIFRETP